MNVLFLTLLGFDSINDRNIYTDLLRQFLKHDHKIFVISPIERQEKQRTHLIVDGNTTILRLKIGNTQKTNIIEKGISTLLIEPLFSKAIAKYFADIKFDLVLYSTPPITLYKAIDYVKKRDGAKSYLLLKDIFPQNAVDLGMMSTSGPSSILYKYFRRKEKKLYDISDRIGCMSPANVQYLLDHNPEIPSNAVDVCPNSIEILDKSVDEQTRIAIRNYYGIPVDKTVFVYGGNLGKPQGVPYLINLLRSQHAENAFFLIIGDGTEFGLLESFLNENNFNNIKLMKRLPKEIFDNIIAACDYGMIFLDYRFTIPNFPSRLLSYLQARLPVVAFTDNNTDLKDIIIKEQFGFWHDSIDVKDVNQFIESIINNDAEAYKDKAYECLTKYYSVEKAYNIIMNNDKDE